MPPLNTLSLMHRSKTASVCCLSKQDDIVYGAGTNFMMLTRRKFAVGCGAFAASGIFGEPLGFTDPAPEGTHLPIPMLIDAAKQGNAAHLKAMSGRHAFIEGKPTGTYGYSAPVLGPVLRVRRGDEVQVTVENALNTVTTVHWHGLLASSFKDQPTGGHAVVSSPSASRHRSPDLFGSDGYHDHR